MNNSYRFLLVVLFAITILACEHASVQSIDKEIDKEIDKLFPYMDRDLERQFPEVEMHLDAYKKAKEEVQRDIQKLSKSNSGFDKEWTIQGPGNLGARINTVAVDPFDKNIIIVGYAGGGLWRTQDGGASWTDIFDAGIYNSIAHITFDSKNQNTIYIGTGDPNVPGRAYLGHGVYKSTDGGDTWVSLGLTEQSIISKVRIHPEDSQILYAGSMGLPFSRNDTRGLYRSMNGGLDWEKIFYVSDSTGVTDVLISPEDPDILFVSTWDRVRNYRESLLTGVGSGIYRSTDNGANWAKAEGIPDTALCRTGITICKNQPHFVYAITVDTERHLSAIYRSDNNGESFSEVPTDQLRIEEPLGGFGWYFGKIEVDPNDPDHIYVLGVDLWETTDAGLTWQLATPIWFFYDVHADKHDLDITDDGALYLATDGGLYLGRVGSEDWQDLENIPTTQFYRVAYNPHEPSLYYGGAQDNGTTGGNANFLDEWPRIYGGDGFQPVFDPVDPDHWFVETQRGGINMTIDGFSFEDATQGLEGETNWNMPYIMSHHTNQVMYAGTDQVYISRDSYQPEWTPISPILTESGFQGQLPASITTLSESPLDRFVLYAGTNNGQLWVTSDFAATWQNISEGIPLRNITSVLASPTALETAYVTLSGYLDNDFTPRVYRTEDLGKTWVSITSNLPNIAVNDILVIPNTNDRVIFVATDGGIYGTVDAGNNWERLGTNMPNMVVADMVYNPVTEELVAATFGRSIMSYEIASILAIEVNTEENSALVANIFPNPGADKLTIRLQKVANIDIIHLSGQSVLSLKGMIGDNDIDISALATGPYIIKTATKEGVTADQFIKI